MTDGTTAAPGTAATALRDHDIRAALSEVMGGLRLVDGAGLSDEARRQIARIRTAAEALARLLEGGLAIQGFDPGLPLPHLPPSILDLGAMLEEMRLRWRAQAMAKAIGFSLDTAADLPRAVRADRAALDGVLSCLLSDMAREDGPHHVAVQVWMPPSGHLTFAIRSTGPREGETVASGAGARTGLIAARNLATRMGATLTHHQVAGDEAEILFSLPLGHDTPHDATPDGQAQADLSNIRILLVEHGPAHPQPMARILERMGALVHVAGDGPTALRLLDRIPFDAAVIDLELPDPPGLDLIHAVRARQDAAADLPVVALSAFVLRSNRAAIQQAGADVTLSKPVMCPISLGQAVVAAIAGRKAGAAAGAAAGALGRTAVPDDATFRRLLELAGPVAGAELVLRLNEDLQTVERGLIAALTPPDWAEIRAHSHVLISLAGAVGAKPLQTMAEALNALAHAQNADVLAQTGARILALLDALIQYVADRRAGLGMGSDADGNGASHGASHGGLT